MALCRCCWCHMARLVTWASVTAIRMLPPMLRAKLMRPATWLLCFLGHADVGGVGDGDEAEGQRHHLDDAQPGGLREGHVEVGDGGGDTEGEDEHDEADDGQPAGGDFAGGNAGQGHDEDQRECRRR